MNRDDLARRGNEDNDWSSGGEVVNKPRTVSMVYSTRLPDDLSRWLEDDATRRGINPSALLRELVAEARRASEQDKTVTVRMSELHKAINQVADRAA